MLKEFEDDRHHLKAMFAKVDLEPITYIGRVERAVKPAYQLELVDYIREVHNANLRITFLVAK